MNIQKFNWLFQQAPDELGDRFNEIPVPHSIANLSEQSLEQFFHREGWLMVVRRPESTFIAVIVYNPKTKKWTPYG